MTACQLTGSMTRAALFGSAFVLLWLHGATAWSQSALLPPECAGKTGAQLDQCVRDIARPATGAEVFEPVEPKPDPRHLLNCNIANRADMGFCIARNDIVLECRNPAKHRDFDACVNYLIGRQPLPGDADCARVAAAQRNQCEMRNKVFRDCQKEPWLYFICLGEKTSAK